MQVRIILEQVIEVVRGGNIQAATIEIDEVREAREPGGEVERLEAVRARADHTIFPTLTEV